LTKPVNALDAWYAVPSIEYARVPDEIEAVMVIVPFPAIPVQPGVTADIKGLGLTVAVTATLELGQVPL
jgi:hypothetical protein